VPECQRDSLKCPGCVGCECPLSCLGTSETIRRGSVLEERPGSAFTGILFHDDPIELSSINWRVKGKRLVRFARRWQSWVGPSVAPIEGVQLRIGVLKLKNELAACVDTTMHGVTHLGFLVFEAIGQ
jgi:hypothetical protein